MQYREQERRVERLSALATESRLQAVDLKHAMRDWKQDRFGRLEVYVWLFGAGAFLGAKKRRRKNKEDHGDDTDDGGKSTTRSVLGLANLGIVAWRYLMSPLSPLSATQSTPDPTSTELPPV